MIPKFRAWDYDKKRMHDVLVIDWLNGLVDLDFGNIEKPFGRVELMQSTRLKDINGVEIYEGDIVKIDDYFNGEMKAKVIFEKGSFGFVGIDKIVSDIVNSNWNDDFLSTSYLSWAYDHPDNDLSNVIIIGNIYENTELMEVTK